MDKSEGRSFFNKTLSTVSDKVAKWYHTGNVKLSISSLKRARSEKVQILGNKVFELISQGKSVTGDKIQEEYASIVELDEQIKLANADLKRIQAEGAAEATESTTKRARKSKTTDTTKEAKSSRVRKSSAATAEKAEKSAKSGRAKKADSANTKPKKPRAKRVPAVKPENKPAVRVENKPAVQNAETKADAAEADV